MLAGVVPLVLESGIAMAGEVDIDTLADGLRVETVAAGGVVKAVDLVSAWTQKPLTSERPKDLNRCIVQLHLDGDGYLIQRRGVTGYPGLYFVGLPWLHTFASGLIVGVGNYAAYVASHIQYGTLRSSRGSVEVRKSG
jgi:hypothetical protein